ncbi:hypothetical protein Tco_1135627 [Tanacetum coccineum]
MINQQPMLLNQPKDISRLFRESATCHRMKCLATRSINGGGTLGIRGYGGGGDMVIHDGLKRCLDHRIIRSSPILPPLL